MVPGSNNQSPNGPNTSQHLLYLLASLNSKNSLSLIWRLHLMKGPNYYKKRKKREEIPVRKEKETKLFSFR